MSYRKLIGLALLLVPKAASGGRADADDLVAVRLAA
jgi:hypothetical protein